MQSLHPLAILPREALKVAQPLRHYATYRRKTYESLARRKLRDKALPAPPQEGHNDPIKTAKTVPAGSFLDPEQSLPTNQELMMACDQGRLGLSIPKSTEFLHEVARAIPWDAGKIADLAQKHHCQPQDLADLARLMYPWHEDTHKDRRNIGEHMLRAASELKCPQATLDMSELSYGPAWRPTMHHLWEPRLPHRSHLEEIGTKGEGSMEAMMLSGILREAHDDLGTANQWYDRVWRHWQSLSKRPWLRKPFGDARQDDLSKRLLNSAIAQTRTLSHPAARALMLKGRNLYEDPLKPLEESQYYFEKAAEEFDDPMAHTFLAMNHRNLSLRTRIHHATKGAMSGEWLASRFLSEFYETGYTNLSEPIQTDYRASAEWQMREIKPTLLERLSGLRKLADADQDVKRWWQGDVGAARKRRDLKIYWEKLFALQRDNLLVFFFAAWTAGQGYHMAVRAAEALKGNQMAQALVLWRGERRYEQFVTFINDAQARAGNLQLLKERWPKNYQDLLEFDRVHTRTKMKQMLSSNKYLEVRISIPLVLPKSFPRFWQKKG